ncbi:DotI/IcmL/TraM family protein [Acetobacter oeni]|uniref:Type IV secretion protein DotI n=1 Tax=Acetobacter oeni TaxID=304077 RepID=A0A511XPC8_9PROT|nr:DotI/IcmL/TraM family protein [Acetobacter oeni]MBB3884594.1 intracellular multiplication protein IcmL [Acetobacter oeni]NHO20551.1 type IV secretion protein DotI [Acetobacter oeni]GBR07518.1 DotI/IcmL protein [Acetobacter oeni LMG 21952]GEN64822.1 hypothetical protein AOE01nite_30460 [Acetobacter oeni]
MKLFSSAVTRRLTDPDFQGIVVDRSLMLNVALAAVVVAFTAHDAYVRAHPPKPLYFFVDGQNAPRPAVALTSPVLGQDQLLGWAVKWAIAPYNINYRDFPTQMNTAGAHYTLNGWNTFAKSFITQGNLAKLREAKLLCYAQPTRAATVRAETVVQGHSRYVVQFPFIQTCENVNQQNTQMLMATVTIDRVEDLDHPEGLAIEQLVVSSGREG